MDCYHILVSDIGGTNARFVLYEIMKANLHPDSSTHDLNHHNLIYQAKYKNKDFDSFHAVLSQFITDASHETEKKIQVCVACLAVAGPVNNNRVNFTNRANWILDGVEISLAFGIQKVKLLNDFGANGYGLLTLKEEEVVTLQKGKFDKNAPIACVGAGTGLGECFLTPSSGFYDTYSTEGGHVEFAPRDKEQTEMLEFLWNKFQGRVSVERIVSGRGLVNVYEFLRSKYPDQVDENLDKKILTEEEGGYVISKNVYENQLCKKALDLMLEIYGAEVGNAALKYLPYGGLYIAGGIAPKNLASIEDESKSNFLKAFREKGRVSGTLKDVPLKVVLCEDLGMRGAHLMAHRLLLSIVQVQEWDGHNDQSYFSQPSSILISKDEIKKQSQSFDISGPLPSPGNEGNNNYYPVPAMTSTRNSRLDLDFVISVGVASGVAASVGILVAFGARQLLK